MCKHGWDFARSPDASHVCSAIEQDLLDWLPASEVSGNNRTLAADGPAAQQLSADDIAELKGSGKSGDEIVAALLANSRTYQSKTQYSQAGAVRCRAAQAARRCVTGAQSPVRAQEKYRRKKARKYVHQAVLQRPTPRTVCEMVLSKSPARIHWMRADTLAILLNLSNVAAHAKVCPRCTCPFRPFELVMQLHSRALPRRPGSNT